MKKYIVAEKPLYLTAGVLELADKQAASRRSCLKPLKKRGQYEIVDTVCFKVGEEIGYSGNISKMIAPGLLLCKKEEKTNTERTEEGED